MKINTITSLCKFLGLTPTNDGLGIFFFRRKISIKENICSQTIF